MSMQTSVDNVDDIPSSPITAAFVLTIFISGIASIAWLLGGGWSALHQVRASALPTILSILYSAASYIAMHVIIDSQKSKLIKVILYLTLTTVMVIASLVIANTGVLTITKYAVLGALFMSGQCVYAALQSIINVGRIIK